MKIPTAIAAQKRITRQITLIITGEPDSTIWANAPLGIGVSEGRGVAVSAVGMGVSVVGRTTASSGASNRVGDGVIEYVAVGVGVSVNGVGVMVGGADVDVLPGAGVRVLVGVGDFDGVDVFCVLGVLLGVDVSSNVAVGVFVTALFSVTEIGPCVSMFWLVSIASRI